MANDRTTRGVARIWRGRTPIDRAEEYTSYLYEHGVRKLEKLGSRGVLMYREDKGDEAEFMVISHWDSREAMSSWAGDDPNKIRHLERDPEFLVEVPKSVQVLEIYSNNWMLADAMR